MLHLLLFTILAVLTPIVFSWESMFPRLTSISRVRRERVESSIALVSKSIIASTMLQYPLVANAVQGSIKSSTLQESKDAVSQIKSCLSALNSMDALVASGDFQKIADMLSGPPFSTLESSAGVLVRSDSLTPEDKVALGTIKRYGVVADALIMIGGLSGELKAAGFKLKESGGGLQAAIEDDEADDDDDVTKPPINVAEVKKYVKLSYGSIADIYRIVKPIEQK